MSTLPRKLLVFAVLACVLILAGLILFSDEHSALETVEGIELMILRVPAAILETTPVTKSETITLRKQGRFDPLRVLADSGSKIEVEATYHHRVELKNTWNFLFDPKRSVAFIIIPDLQSIIPVEFKIVREKKVIGGFDVDSKWFWKFEDKEQIKERIELLQNLKARLEENAVSEALVGIRMEEARKLVESHIRNWLIAERHIPAGGNPVVKIFTASDFASFPLPDGASIGSFHPDKRSN
jgi:hypothetical protein